MTTAAARTARPMLPYREGGPIDYASLDFDPDRREPPPDDMLQKLEIAELFGLLCARYTDFNQCPDVFVDYESFICYDPSNLNVKVSPDIYLAFGVDTRAIRPRRLYIPWEAGKAPDLVIEIASESTAREDLLRKPAIYAAIGSEEFWLLDPSGGRFYGQAIIGLRLVNGEYHRIELTTEPDGVLKGYSEVLGLYLCCDEGWPRLYDQTTGRYDENWREVWVTREAERAGRQSAERERDDARALNLLTGMERDEERTGRLDAEAERDAARIERDEERTGRLDAEAEIARLRERLRRLES